jgi:hypothetical protein
MAVITAVWLEVTVATAVTANVAVIEPEGMVTEAGTVAAAVLPLESITVVPPGGAGLVMVTCPVEMSPPVVVVGFRVSALTVIGGVTTSRNDCMAPLNVAVNKTFTGAPTVVVVSVKVACVAPAWTVTTKLPSADPAGTVMLLPVGTGATVVLLVVTVTAVPPVGAGRESNTVHVVIVPPTSTPGEKIKLDSAVCGGPRVSMAVADEAFSVAVSVTGVADGGPEVKT